MKGLGVREEVGGEGKGRYVRGDRGKIEGSIAGGEGRNEGVDDKGNVDGEEEKGGRGDK